MNNKLSFEISISGLDDKFVVTKFVGDEKLSSTFDFNIQLASRFQEITAVDVVDKNVKLTQLRDGMPTRSWYGVISSFTVGDTGHSHTFYNITMVPALKRLSLRQNIRIFQTCSVPEIISEIFCDADISEYAFILSKDYVKREYCMQYRETDLEFIQRIAAEEGIFYFFEHSTNDRVLLSDNSSVLASFNNHTQFPYNALAGGSSSTPCIKTFSMTKQLKPSTAKLKDYSFKNPNYSFLLAAQANNADYQREYEYFDHPGRYKSDEHGKNITQVRLEALRNDAIFASSESNIEHLTTGFKFNLSDHPDSAFNRDWIIVSIHHEGSQPQALEEAGGEGITTYNNKFTVVPGNIFWRPDPITKPIIPGTQPATVVGPEGEEIYCDEYGRVKVFFPWDLYQPNNDSCSCWLRVASPDAGAQFGYLAIPRVGQEVLVAFLHGDPDLPYVSGSMYNALNKPPYELPQYKATTTIRSESYLGSGYNEISFDNVSGKERIYTHAQRNYELWVGNNEHRDIKGSHHTTVDGDHITHVKKDLHEQIDGNSVKQADLINVSSNNLAYNQSGNSTYKSGGTHHVKASNIVLEADANITLRVGGSFLTISSSGINLVGMELGFNAGGSPIAPPVNNMRLPLLPNGIEQIAPNPIELDLSQFKSALKESLVPRKCDKNKDEE